MKFSSKTAMTILLMLLVAVEWLFASVSIYYIVNIYCNIVNIYIVGLVYIIGLL